jgi:hypothetical protein
VDIWVPEGAVPGLCPGSVEVDTGPLPAGLPPISISEFNVEVLSYALPSTSSRYATAYNCDISGMLAGKYLGDLPKGLAPAEKIGLMKSYADLGLMHRPAAPCPPAQPASQPAGVSTLAATASIYVPAGTSARWL